MPRARSHRLLIHAAHAVDVALDWERWALTFVWNPGDPELRRLRVQLARVALAAFGPAALPRVRWPFVEGERIVILKASSSRPGAVIAPTGESLGAYADDEPVLDASLTAFACECDGELRVEVRLGNVRLAESASAAPGEARRS